MGGKAGWHNQRTDLKCSSQSLCRGGIDIFSTWPPDVLPGCSYDQAMPESCRGQYRRRLWKLGRVGTEWRAERLVMARGAARHGKLRLGSGVGVLGCWGRDATTTAAKKGRAERELQPRQVCWRSKLVLYGSRKARGIFSAVSCPFLRRSECVFSAGARMELHTLPFQSQELAGPPNGPALCKLRLQLLKIC